MSWNVGDPVWVPFLFEEAPIAAVVVRVVGNDVLLRWDTKPDRGLWRQAWELLPRRDGRFPSRAEWAARVRP